MCGHTQYNLKNFCETTLRSLWSTDTFDQWLFLDAGTEFGHAFHTHITNNAILVQDGKRSARDIGKLCVYEIQLHVRKNPNHTLDTILECANQYILNLFATNAVQEKKGMHTNYSYFF